MHLLPQESSQSVGECMNWSVRPQREVSVSTQHTASSMGEKYVEYRNWPSKTASEATFRGHQEFIIRERVSDLQHSLQKMLLEIQLFWHALWLLAATPPMRSPMKTNDFSSSILSLSHNYT